jgi:hypothetical protein
VGRGVQSPPVVVSPLPLHKRVPGLLLRASPPVLHRPPGPTATATATTAIPNHTALLTLRLVVTACDGQGQPGEREGEGDWGSWRRYRAVAEASVQHRSIDGDGQGASPSRLGLGEVVPIDVVTASFVGPKATLGCGSVLAFAGAAEAARVDLHSLELRGSPGLLPGRSNASKQ